MVEQPWAVAGVVRALGDRREKTLVIYSGQNVEWRITKEILYQSGFKTSVVDPIAAIVKDIEEDAIKAADEIWMVTKNDQRFAKRLNSQTLLLPNGVESRPECDDTISRIPYVVFIGSSYPPNYNGFIDWVGFDFTFLPPGSKVVVAGSVSENIRHMFSSHGIDVPPQELVLLGKVGEDELNRLICGARAVLVPLSEGGGSSLKMAEALASGKEVITTLSGIRGFELWKSTPGVTVCVKPSEFRKQISKTLLEPNSKPVSRESRQSSPLYWDDCLRPINEGVLAPREGCP